MAGRTVPAHHRCEFTCKGFLASAWGQRGSHQLAGKTGGEHVSAADPVTYPMGRVPQEVGPTTLDHLRVDASAAAPHMVGRTEGDRDDSCHGASNPTGGGAHHATKAEPHVRRSTSARIKTILFFLERCVLFSESLRGCPGFLGGFVGVWFCLSSLGWPWMWCVCSV